MRPLEIESMLRSSANFNSIWGQTTTYKNNNISKTVDHYYCHFFPNMTLFFKLMAQKFSLVRVCSIFFLR
jgi:hypothetical protein